MPTTLINSLSNVAGARVDDVRDAIAAAPPPGIIFAAVAAISGPFALVGLVVDGQFVLPAPVASNGRSATFDLTQHINALPTEIGWAVLAGHDIPEIATFLLVNSQVFKLRSKKKLARGKLWADSKEVP